MDKEEVVYKKLEVFCKINEPFHAAFRVIEKKSVQLFEKINASFYFISNTLLHQNDCFDAVFEYFLEEIPIFLNIALGNEVEIDRSRHLLNCVLLGRVLKRREDLADFAVKYFESHPGPFDSIKTNGQTIPKDEEILEASYIILKSNPEFYRSRWTFSKCFQKYINSPNKKIKWLLCRIAGVLSGMNEDSFQEIFQNEAENKDLSCKFDKFQTLFQQEKRKIDKVKIKFPKFQNQLVTNISGIYLPMIKNASCEDTIVEVESTRNNLRKIALGLTLHKAICLQGPVGSGKTSLIEYLAIKTGRTLGEDFIKVQIGDQTDSKMLLGTYHCTDIPGEFIWQPGVLTQAILEGYWLLLEDIDLASMDIASVLASLLETNSLTVPGYRDSIQIKSGFQLFVTQRLIATMSGYHRKHSNTMTLLQKNLLQINIDPLEKQELKEIIDLKFSQFRTITDRLINVFTLFTESETPAQKSARMISTRDFFKWCNRAAIDFDISSQESALKVLQDAIDVFCGSLTNRDQSLALAKEISTQLGIINQKAEYFYDCYKPNMQLASGDLIVGRAKLQRQNSVLCKAVQFSFTRPTAVLLERIMVCLSLQEPVLLVGETGTGKTSTVQYLANTIGQKLVVINMNQQSDSADLLGGFKPVNMKFIVEPVRNAFESVFCDYFNVEANRKFLNNIKICFNAQRWNDLFKLMTKSYLAAMKRLQDALKNNEDKVKKDKDKAFLQRWQNVGEKLNKLSLQMKQKNALAFAFIEGSLVKAVEEGCWVLLDEINLANAETLECLSGLLEGSKGSLCLLERGDKRPIKRHEKFALFACMNPSTDVGKKDLPAGLRNRFTELFVDELTERNDLLLLVNNYLEALSLNEKYLNKIVSFYLRVRKEALISLSDGLGHKPHYSLRSLCRALMIASKNPCGVFKRSLFEAFCLSFLTQLDSQSYKLVETLIVTYILGDEKSYKAIIKQPIPKPTGKEEYTQFEGYWIRQGGMEVSIPEDYILTDSVRRNLKDLVRVVSIGKLPVLLQGDTSVGKTSLITYLAKASGNKCVRINNHEHTDLQEYIGSYVADATGNLVFREGLLVEAMRQGHWIILDELNLAPSDVLEALNRVLDDNRELFIPETRETIKANPNFMLFATQNPPGAYGGRKMLSRAFRNRFVELHFNEIPPVELEFILHKRCQVAPSYAKKMIQVMTDLQMRRRGSAAFAGKQGFITLRDLFRWGERYRLAQKTDKLYDWDQHLADEGFLVLAGRVRKGEEKAQIIEVLQKHLKREVIPNNLFTLSEKTSTVTRHILQFIEENKKQHKNIVWTYNMRQLAVLVSKAIEFKEPVLLVGETGGGKTTVCQLIADSSKQKLITINCHMHTESSDFIGGLRPVRDHSKDSNKLFEWIDGPLIEAMTQGQVFLADEISLADDSVLERLNSLLEPERCLLLAEKGIDLNNSNNSELIKAHEKFSFIGTMNPGGDFGKKELSPALRNRFTEIWCEACTDRNDLIAIVEANIHPGLSLGNQEDNTSGIGNCIISFIEWFKSTDIGKRFTISIRDILTWVGFLNSCLDKVDITEAYLHGAFLTFLDGLGSGITSTENWKSLETFRKDCEHFLKGQLKDLQSSFCSDLRLEVVNEKEKFGVHPFYIKKGNGISNKEKFCFNAVSTISNTMRLLRGMQLNKPILLEGSPGVGKTSLVTALAKWTNHHIFRVNLSDQTDISDLFGADLPVEGGSGGQFAWRDGPLLLALKKGDWILLDELNLASQSVLEGLNACLDHRGEIYIPELGKTFYVKPGTRFFGCQNPLKQGGSRRGLPQSFLNRFIQVYINPLTTEDLHRIVKDSFPEIPEDIVDKIIEFNEKIGEALDGHLFGNKGAPWECNLRDVSRWCEAIVYYKNNMGGYWPEKVVKLIYGDRMRSQSDKEKVEEVFEGVFGRGFGGEEVVAYVNKKRVYLGDVWLERAKEGVNNSVWRQEKSCLVLRGQLGVLRSLAYCVNLNWMTILVGGSGCGKSSVVRTLANLAGRTLKTLPVTSAMDTTDILGGFEQTDYSRHLDEIFKETEEVLFRNIQRLFKSKQEEKACSLLSEWEQYLETERKCQGMEGIDLFKNKCKGLIQILVKLNKEQLDQKEIMNKLENLLSSVEQCGSLNAGGKFEWVDSVLIKCLKKGTWLLIDNVNLCSAAVLDRLNGLLEPNGVLTIAERGVDDNGRMVEIKPHKDFRLFLTMDPKNGEISRAMRNRGIEIYMLDDESSLLDMKSLINQNGLKEHNHIQALIKIHAFINGLLMGEKCSNNEMLNAASLIAQQLNCGISLSEAFSNAVIEVYWKTRNPIEFNCSGAGELIKAEIEKVLNETLDGESDNGFSPKCTLKTLELEESSTLAKVKQQMTPLLHYLSFPETKIDSFLKGFIFNSFSVSSKEDLDIRKIYSLQEITIPTVKGLIELVVKKLDSVSNQLEIDDLPFDSDWLHFSYGKKKDLINLNLYLLLEYFLEAYKKTKCLEELKKDNCISLLEYMQERRKNSIEDKFNNIVIERFLNLMEMFDQYLEQVISIGVGSNVDCIKVLMLLKWRFIFYEYTFINVKNLASHDAYQLVSNFIVHYKWFYKRCIQQSFSLLEIKLPDNLNGVINEINGSLEEQFSGMRKLSKSYQSGSNRPPPLVSLHQLDAVPRFNRICDLYDLCDKRNEQFRMISLLRSEPGLRKAIVDLKAEMGFGFGDVAQNLMELEAIHMQCEQKAVNVDKFAMQMVPVSDHFLRLRLRGALNNLGDSSDLINNSLIPCGLAGVLRRFGDVRLLHEIRRRSFGYLLGSPATRPDSFLQLREGEIDMQQFSPAITYNLTLLLVSDKTGSAVNLGNFRSLMESHKMLNLTLWNNILQLNDEAYDLIGCELRFLGELLESFIKALGKAFRLPEGLKFEEILSEITRNEILSPQFKNVLFDCYQNANSGSGCDLNRNLLLLADLHIGINYLKAMLDCNIPLIDPLVKKALKKKYCEEATNDLVIQKKCFEIQNEIYSNSSKTLHSYHGEIVKFIDLLKRKNEELGKYVAVRPNDLHYETVAKEVNHAFSTILSNNFVDDSLKELSQQIEGLLDSKEINLNKSKGIANQLESRLVSYENLLYEWRKFSAGYPDIVEPLLSDICGFVYGLKLKLGLLKKLIVEAEARLDGFNLGTDLVKLVKLPSLYKEQTGVQEQIQFYTEKLANYLHHVNQEETGKKECLRLLKCGIQESVNHCFLDYASSEVLDERLFEHFNGLLKHFVSAWNKQEEELEIKKKEAESLYKMKTKCDDKPEDVQIEEEMKDLFPNYHDIDFADMQTNVPMDDDPNEVTESIENRVLLSYEDLKAVVELHMKLLQNCTKSEWMNPAKINFNCDLSQALVEKFKTFKLIFERTVNGFAYNLDRELLGSLNILVKVAQNYGLNNSNEISSKTNRKMKDFYKDADVEEVKSSYHVLEELRVRISQLLEEWPDQPTLKSILNIIERVYNFDITSPVSRFLTGFEILLSKCHEWEEVAHSGVSLSQFTQNLTQQIIAWRKLELTMWKDLLNITYERLNEPIAKWWLFLYNIMEQFVIDKSLKANELIETLQTFISKSNLAEFQNRLQLLYTFQCHAIFLDNCKERQLFVNILWNLHSYFSQFSQVVANKIKDLRAPIEKKLKDYVKIVRWKDINYWAIKETVDKSHRTLHKYIREYKDVLLQPVSSYLINIKSDVTNESVGIWDRPQRSSPKKYHYTLDVDHYLTKKSTAKKILNPDVKFEEGLLGKIESYFLKSRKLSREAIKNTKYPNLVQNLDSFVTEVIERSAHLQKLEVDRTLTKEKQKSQAKNILQQKHRALADLFKTLSKIGLSFRTGIIESKTGNASNDFLVKPIDLTANFAHISAGRREEKILTIWDSCEIYYNRTLMRIDILETAMKSPAADLGIQNIERCKGFSSHLKSLCLKQKEELIYSTNSYFYLKYYFKQFSSLFDSQEFVSCVMVNHIMEALKNTSVVMKEFLAILNTCPEEDILDVSNPEIIVLPTKAKFIKNKGDNLWTEAVDYAKSIILAANKLRASLQRSKGNVPSKDCLLVEFSFVPVDLKQIESDLNDIYKNVEAFHLIVEKSSFSESSLWLLNQLRMIQFKFLEEDSFEEYSAEELTAAVSSYTEKLLLIIQNIYKEYSESTETNEEESGNLEEDHLKTLLIDNLSKDVSKLEPKRILKATTKLANMMFKISPKSILESKDIVNCCLPVLEQTLLLYEYFITQQVSSYRISCKLSSILLNIFIDLTSQGFCVPPDLSDEMDKEGVSKPSDGLGLGEGQGERDVSDRIESEDQLDDAQPEGQQKESEDQDCKEEEKGIEMSEDFDSKLQDKEKKGDDDDESSDSDSDANEQMGETEKGADQLDNEIWGSDKEDANEESGDEEESEQKEEKGDKGKDEGNEEFGANEDSSKKKEDKKKDKTGADEKEEKKKDINEMDEQEIDDEQNDPYHGNQPELPEPEPMDLPDDLQLDEGQENDAENPEENPFDVDAMKEDTVPEDKPEETSEEQKENDEVSNYSSDDEDITREDREPNEEAEKEEREDKKDKDVEEEGSGETEEVEGEEDEKGEGEDGLDQNPTNEDNVEAMECDDYEAPDKTQGSQADTLKSNQPIEEMNQEDKPDKEGVGQSQMEESSSGHTAPTTASKDMQRSKREREEIEQAQKPGESNNQRSLGNIDEPVKKKLKTMDSNTNQGEDSQQQDEEMEAEMYQHIKEAKETDSTQVLDAATKEQAEAHRKELTHEEDEKEEEKAEPSKDLTEEEPIQIEETVEPNQKPEKNKDGSEKKSTKKQHPQGDLMEEIQDIDIEGDVVETQTVPRNDESSHHTHFIDLAQFPTPRLTFEEINNLRMDVEKQLSSWNEPPSTFEAEQAWQKISSVTSSLAQDLSEQLRLVLEPTQASRLKGDFRSGRRINMRKVIPYIASQFRKDKIWLRRTKPSKREYQIVIAIDDSSSMTDNRSKELAFESVALISKALNLLESGQLGVLSFGETTEVVHKLTDQFTERSGVKLLQKFKFDQNKTCIGKMVDFTTEMFTQTQLQSSALNAKLLVIISDGRGIFSEGETYVRQAVRRGKLANIFTVFVIIDNPENKNSVLDIRMPVFKDGSILNIQNYMDVFPFSFYIILRDIKSLPNVLSDALRQWFEIVSNLDKQ